MGESRAWGGAARVPLVPAHPGWKMTFRGVFGVAPLARSSVDREATSPVGCWDRWPSLLLTFPLAHLSFCSTFLCWSEIRKALKALQASTFLHLCPVALPQVRMW